ncbi:MAG: FtsX-like permease family protein [Terriglobales bacterium]
MSANSTIHVTGGTPALRSGSRTRMFVRMLMRASLAQPGRTASALMAVAVAATVATAMMTLYVDVQSKLQKEFRSYGANIVVVAHDGQALPQNALAQVEKTLSGRGSAVPFAYAVARTKDGTPIVVAGTDFDRVKKLDAYWAVSSWPALTAKDAQERQGISALVGVKAAKQLGHDFTLSFDGHDVQVHTAGTVQTGAEEDSRVYLDLNEFEQWTGSPVSTIEIGAGGSPKEIETTLAALSAAFDQNDVSPTLAKAARVGHPEVRPVRQIVEGEARVLGKTRAALLAAIALIILTAILCVLATLTAWVLDRRRDFAIMKALGASERLINSFFAAQAATLGAAGAVAGFAAGLAVAAWIGRVNFHAAVQPRWSVLPLVLAGSVAVALVSAVLPISLLRRVQPATILRGE